MKMQKILYSFLLLVAVMCFWACGDDNGSSAEKGDSPNRQGLKVVSAKSDLDSCKKSMEGEMSYVTSTGELLLCLEGDWKTYGVSKIPVYESSDGKDGVNGTDGKDGVNGTDGKDGVNGTDGKDGINGTDGEDGKDGVDGLSCSGEYREDEKGIDIYCGKDFIGTIWNGTDGQTGNNGGTTASIDFNKAEHVEIGDTVWSYSDSLLIRISDNDILTKKDTVEVTVTSTSDSKGIVLTAELRDGFYYAMLFFAQKSSGSRTIKVQDGDNVVISYKDENPERVIKRNVAFILASKSERDFISLDKPWYYGDSAEVVVTVNDKNAEGDTIQVSMILCYNDGYECHYTENEGGFGTYDAHLKLAGAGGLYKGSFFIVNEGKNHDNYFYSDPAKILTVDVRYTFKDEKKTFENVTVYWKKNADSRVEFDADRYNQASKGHFYVYDEGCGKDSVEVTISSKVKGDEIRAVAYRYKDYFYGEFLMNGLKNDGVLAIDEKDTILIQYKDATLGTVSKDMAKAGFALYATVSFGDSLYMDVTDKAVLKLVDESLTENDAVTIRVSSESDFYGVLVDMYTVPGGDGTERIGYVEFTKDPEVVNVENFEKKVFVKDKETLLASYSTNRLASSTKWFEAKAFWADKNTCFIDKRDGRAYKFVTMGDQVWMAENLAYGDGKFYDNDSIKYSSYGKLYTWAQALDTAEAICASSRCKIERPYKGACPSGWHLPSLDEFKTLLGFVSGFSEYGSTPSLLKTSYGWKSYAGVESGKDRWGFGVFPIGYYSSSSDFKGKGERAYFWLDEDVSTTIAKTMYFSYPSDVILDTEEYKTYGYSIRCVKDE
ncbi:major paralogous domain-containing protein [Fibrobacter sp. UWH5]|nr:major paralogous domain-containing protein [Fibrobacter sp. UWH5]